MLSIKHQIRELDNTSELEFLKNKKIIKIFVPLLIRNNYTQNWEIFQCAQHLQNPYLSWLKEMIEQYNSDEFN